MFRISPQLAVEMASKIQSYPSPLGYSVFFLQKPSITIEIKEICSTVATIRFLCLSDERSIRYSSMSRPSIQSDPSPLGYGIFFNNGLAVFFVHHKTYLLIYWTRQSISHWNFQSFSEGHAQTLSPGSGLVYIYLRIVGNLKKNCGHLDLLFRRI